MGCGASGASSEQVAQADAVQQDSYSDLVAIGKKYHLSSGMVKKLPAAFVDGDFDGSLEIDFGEFQELLGIEEGPLLKSLWRTVDKDHSREVLSLPLRSTTQTAYFYSCRRLTLWNSLKELAGSVA